jgi:hypothetical protein
MPRKPRTDPIAHIHVLLTPAEHRRIAMVAASERVKMATLFRSIFLPEINRRFEAIELDGQKTRGRKCG